MDLGLDGRRALVLAGTAGMGLAVARGLAAEGATIAVSGRDPERCRAAARSLGDAGVAVPGDLTVDDGPERVVLDAGDRLGGLDVLVVNTGGGRPGGLLDVTAEDEDAAYRSMLRPALRATRAALAMLEASDQARVVYLTARSVLEASPELALSGVFRSGVAAAARSLAIELAPRVLVNVVVPGQFPTGAYERFEAALAERQGTPAAEIRRQHEAAIPLGRLGRPEELAAAVTFLCSGAASYITGTVLRVDGGSVRGY